MEPNQSIISGMCDVYYEGMARVEEADRKADLWGDDGIRADAESEFENHLFGSLSSALGTKLMPYAQAIGRTGLEGIARSICVVDAGDRVAHIDSTLTRNETKAEADADADIIKGAGNLADASGGVSIQPGMMSGVALTAE